MPAVATIESTKGRPKTENLFFPEVEEGEEVEVGEAAAAPPLGTSTWMYGWLMTTWTAETETVEVRMTLSV